MLEPENENKAFFNDLIGGFSNEELKGIVRESKERVDGSERNLYPPSFSKPRFYTVSSFEKPIRASYAVKNYTSFIAGRVGQTTLYSFGGLYSSGIAIASAGVPSISRPQIKEIEVTFNVEPGDSEQAYAA